MPAPPLRPTAVWVLFFWFGFARGVFSRSCSPVLAEPHEIPAGKGAIDCLPSPAHTVKEARGCVGLKVTELPEDCLGPSSPRVMSDSVVQHIVCL